MEKTLDEVIEEEAQQISDAVYSDYLKEVEKLKKAKEQKNSEKE